MKEECYVMVKPGFVTKEIIAKTIEAMEHEGIKLIDSSLIQYDQECAKLHYIEKQAKPYCQELIDYISSGEAFGMVFEGDNAISRCRDIVEGLRVSLKEEYQLETDVMRNILHCSSKTKVGNEMLELDTQRELALFNYLKKE